MPKTKSEKVRRLAKDGFSVSEIAAKLGVRYQHAYNILKRDRITARLGLEQRGSQQKPRLSVQGLLDSGFRRASRWNLDPSGKLALTKELSKDVGVYAFAIDGIVMYVGLATMGLSKRIYFYTKPGISQRTSLRLNKVMRKELKSASRIHVLVAHPKNSKWKGLPVHGAAGLELGLIKAYSLPWNMRGAK